MEDAIENNLDVEEDVHVGELPDTVESVLPQSHSRKFHRLRKGSRREKEASEDEFDMGADSEVPQPSRRRRDSDDDKAVPSAQEDDVVDTNVEGQEMPQPGTTREDHVHDQARKKKNRRARSPGDYEKETRETKKERMEHVRLSNQLKSDAQRTLRESSRAAFRPSPCRPQVSLASILVKLRSKRQQAQPPKKPTVEKHQEPAAEEAEGRNNVSPASPASAFQHVRPPMEDSEEGVAGKRDPVHCEPMRDKVKSSPSIHLHLDGTESQSQSQSQCQSQDGGHGAATTPQEGRGRDSAFMDTEAEEEGVDGDEEGEEGEEEEEEGKREEEEQEERTRGEEEEEEVQRQELHTKWLQDKEEEMESTLLGKVRKGWMEAGNVFGVGMLDEEDDKKDQPEEEGREESEEEIEEEEMENEEGEEEEKTVTEAGEAEGEEDVDEVALERERWKQFLADSEDASVFVPFEDDEESQEMLRRGKKEVCRKAPIAPLLDLPLLGLSNMGGSDSRDSFLGRSSSLPGGGKSMKKGGGRARGYIFREDSSGGVHQEEGEAKSGADVQPRGDQPARFAALKTFGSLCSSKNEDKASSDLLGRSLFGRLRTAPFTPPTPGVASSSRGGAERGKPITIAQMLNAGWTVRGGKRAQDVE